MAFVVIRAKAGQQSARTYGNEAEANDAARAWRAAGYLVEVIDTNGRPGPRDGRPDNQRPEHDGSRAPNANSADAPSGQPPIPNS